MDGSDAMPRHKEHPMALTSLEEATGCSRSILLPVTAVVACSRIPVEKAAQTGVFRLKRTEARRILRSIY